MTRSAAIRALIVAILCFSAPSTGQQASTTTASPSSTKNVSKLEVEVIYLGRDGCFPSKITRPQGQPFRLVVMNKSGNPNVQLSLQAAGSLAVQSAKQFNAVDANWPQLINLPAGTYTLTSAGSQKFGCTLTLK